MTADDRRMLGRLDGESGQVLPVLLLVMVALVAAGVLFAQVGRAGVLEAKAQTAADAAALAAGEVLAGQFSGLDAGGFDVSAVCAAAGEFAARNDAQVVACRREGFEVQVAVQASGSVEDGRLSSAGEPAGAEARAAVEPVYVGGVPFGELEGAIGDAILLGQSMGLRLTSFHRPGDTDSWHSRGVAADLAGTPEDMAAFYRAALARYSQIEELIYSPMGFIDKNISIPPPDDHFDHVHIALLGDQTGPVDGGGSAGGGDSGGGGGGGGNNGGGGGPGPGDVPTPDPGAYGSVQPEVHLVPVQ